MSALNSSRAITPLSRVLDRLETLLMQGLKSKESKLTSPDFKQVRGLALAQLKSGRKQG